METVKVKDLIIGKNPRATKRNAHQLDLLARAIAAHGVMVPVEARRTAEGLELVDGFGRIEALALAAEKYADIAKENGVDLTVVPYHSMGKASNKVAALEPILRNNFRTNMNDVDTAKQVERCIAEGHDVSEMEQLFGTAKFKQLRQVAELEPAVQKLIASGKVKTSFALTMANKYGDKAATKLEKAAAKVEELVGAGQRKNTKITQKVVEGEGKATMGKVARQLIEKVRGNDQYANVFQVLLRLRDGQSADEIFDAVEAGDDFIEPVKEEKAPKVKGTGKRGRKSNAQKAEEAAAAAAAAGQEA
jgi:hypothetical protein